MNPVILNGKLEDGNSPLLTIYNRAFRYGDGLFESMRMINGHIPFLNAHLDRLGKSMELLQLPSITELGKDQLEKNIEKLADHQHTANGRCRLTVFRRGEGLYEPLQNESGYLLELVKMEPDHFIFPDKGLITGVSSFPLKMNNPLANLKVTSALPYVFASIQKKEQGLDDIFLLNTENRIAEATSSNVFIFNGEYWITPPLSEGCVDGVMRKQIMKIAEKKQMKLTEEPVSVQQLQDAQEVMLVNAVAGIKWVRRLKKKDYANRQAEKMNGYLNELLRTPP